MPVGLSFNLSIVVFVSLSYLSIRLGCLEIGVFVYLYTYTFLDISICSFQCTMLTAV